MRLKCPAHIAILGNLHSTVSPAKVYLHNRSSWKKFHRPYPGDRELLYYERCTVTTCYVHVRAHALRMYMRPYNRSSIIFVDMQIDRMWPRVLRLQHN